MKWAVAILLASVAVLWEYNRRFSLPQVVRQDELLEAYDFVVVGAGSAGAAVAARLAEGSHFTTLHRPEEDVKQQRSDVEVLLLEAGSTGRAVPYASVPAFMAENQNTDIDWKFLSEPQQHAVQGHVDKRSKWPRGKVVGGTSVLNSMIHVRGRKGDHERWETKLGCKGWGWADVEPYYRKLEQVTFGAQKPALRGHSGPIQLSKILRTELGRAYEAGAKELGYPWSDELNGELQEGFFNSEQAISEGKRRGSWEYLDRTRDRKNFHILPEAHVTKILLDDAKKVVGVEYMHGGWKKRVNVHKEAVVSGGAVGSPHLLMLSGIGPRKHLEEFGIKVLVDSPHVGQNMQDHIMTGWPLFNLNRSATPNPTITHDDFYSLTNAKRGLEYALHSTGPWNSSWVEVMGLVHSGAQPKTNTADIQIQVCPIYNMAGIGHRLQGLRPEVEAAETAKAFNNHFFAVCSGLQQPFSRGEIRLKSADPLAHPAIDPKYLSHPRDLDATVKGLEVALKIIKGTKAMTALSPVSTEAPVPGCEKHEMWSRPYLECFVKSKTLTIYHPASTCRMGPDRTKGVVDLKLQVYGVSGLRVADTSAFPDIVSVNTNAAAVMLGERAAAILLEEHL